MFERRMARTEFWNSPPSPHFQVYERCILEQYVVLREQRCEPLDSRLGLAPPDPSVLTGLLLDGWYNEHRE